MVYQNQPLDLLIDVQKVGALSSTHQSQLWRELCQAEDSESSNTFHGFPNFFMDISGQRPSIHQNTLKLESPHGASDPSVGTVRHGSKADTLIPRTEWTPALHCRAEALSVGRSMRGSIPRMCHHCLRGNMPPIYMFGYINCPIFQTSASMSNHAKSVYGYLEKIPSTGEDLKWVSLGHHIKK